MFFSEEILSFRINDCNTDKYRQLFFQKAYTDHGLTYQYY